MEEKSIKQKATELWENLRDSMYFTRKPGCPFCTNLVLDEDGKPLVSHPTARQNQE